MFQVLLLSLKCSLRESWPLCSLQFLQGLAWCRDLNIRGKMKQNFSLTRKCSFGFAGPVESLAVPGTAPPRAQPLTKTLS